MIRMKRFDLVMGSALLLLGSFVTREALATRARIAAAETPTTSFGTAPIEADSFVPIGDSVPVRRVATPATPDVPARLLDIRRRLELSSHDTYIEDVIVAHDSAIARWHDRVNDPLRVWVQPTARYSDFNAANVPVVRRAFSEWADLGLPVPFTFVIDSSLADVHVTWIEQFNEPISGKTLWAHDDGWWIIDANIQLAVRHHSGELLDSSAVRAIAMHEVGHLLGLDHTTDTLSIMAPKVRVRELSAADRATAQLLYKLPAGKIGKE